MLDNDKNTLDEAPWVIIITTQDEQTYAPMAKAFTEAGYNVAFPEHSGVTDLFTTNSEGTAFAVIDLDTGDLRDYVGLISEITQAMKKASISHMYRVPILAISNDPSLEQPALNAGATQFAKKEENLQRISIIALSLDDNEEAPPIAQALNSNFPPPEDW